MSDGTDSTRRAARHLGVAMLVVVLGACTSPATRPTAGAPTLAFDHESLVVVTVANPVSAGAVGAGSTPRGYSVSGGYQVSAQAAATVQALQQTYGVQAVDAWPITVLGVHCVVFATGGQDSADAVMRRLAADFRVESVQPLNAFRTLSRSGPDPHRSLQHGLDVLQLDAAHTRSRGVGVRIAVIDSGIDAEHPDLAGRVAIRHDLVGDRAADTEHHGEDHGTAVAGVIAAVADNATGIVGVAPDARLVALRACWPRGNAAACNSFTLARALTAAIEARVDIINLSLGGPSDPLLQRLVEAAHDRGMVVVGARPPDADARFPTDIPGVIAARVAGVAGSGVPAPGEAILTTRPGGRYRFHSGSSMAAAHVSGVVALLLAADNSLTRDDLTRLLTANLQPVAAPNGQLVNPTSDCINACESLATLTGDLDCNRPGSGARIASR